MLLKTGSFINRCHRIISDNEIFKVKSEKIISQKVFVRKSVRKTALKLFLKKIVSFFV